MKTVNNNAQVAHLFANNSQDSARNSGNTFHFEREDVWLAEGKRELCSVLYSYRTPIAFFRVSKPDVIFVTDESYSVTTSAQLCDLRRASSHRALYSVPGASRGNYGWIAGLLNKATCKASMLRTLRQKTEAILSAKRARPGQCSRLRFEVGYLTEAYGRLHRGGKLAFKLHPEILHYALTHDEAVRSRNETREAYHARETEEHNARVAVELAEKLPLWKAGQVDRLPYHHGPAYLRLTSDGETVQTSQGAEVPLKLALAFYERLTTGEAMPGQHVGAFSFESEQAESVKIGCHTILKSEMAALRAALPIAA